MSNNLKKYVSNERGKTLLRVILNSSYHLQSIIEDALDLSRMENNKFEINYEETDIREILDDI